MSAARMAASLRSTRSVAKAVLPNRMGRIGHRLSGHSNGKRGGWYSLSVGRTHLDLCELLLAITEP
jgi:hypothetical protein